jgi:hypothetical protein
MAFAWRVQEKQEKPQECNWYPARDLNRVPPWGRLSF